MLPENPIRVHLPRNKREPWVKTLVRDSNKPKSEVLAKPIRLVRLVSAMVVVVLQFHILRLWRWGW